MSRPPFDHGYSWMRPVEPERPDDDPGWCDVCDRPLRLDLSCPFCGADEPPRLGQ